MEPSARTQYVWPSAFGAGCEVDCATYSLTNQYAVSWMNKLSSQTICLNSNMTVYFSIVLVCSICFHHLWWNPNLDNNMINQFYSSMINMIEHLPKSPIHWRQWHWLVLPWQKNQDFCLVKDSDLHMNDFIESSIQHIKEFT